MSFFRLIFRNLRYYWQKNLLLALGVSVSAAVLTGTLIVGDSVKYSLGKIVTDRLGAITHVVKSGDRYLTVDLARKLGQRLGQHVSPALLLNGIAQADGGSSKVNYVNIMGVDSTFDQFPSQEGLYSQLKGDELVISRNLASRLSVNVGDDVLLKITRASLVPMNAPFVSNTDNIVSSRFVVTGIADVEQLGMFNLENIQTAPYNAFVSLETLNLLMDFQHKANLLLIESGNSLVPGEILDIIAKEWSLEDAGLNLEVLNKYNELEINSERVFIEEGTSTVLIGLEGIKYPILTYFVNSLSLNSLSTPYSFVSTLPDSSLKSNEIIINQWLADDLGAKAGDTVILKYFIMGPLRELSEEEAPFIISSIAPMEGMFADKNRMPHLPGLSDAGNCRDWETGIPIDLESIRDKDEKYWDEWKGTPKAFIARSKAVELWKNRYGNYTAFRYFANKTKPNQLEQDILKSLHPAALGFTAENLRIKADTAAASGVNFSQLFAGLSFFLLMAGVLLSLLLFLLNLEFRKGQLQTLSRLGIPAHRIFRVMFSEGILVSTLGAFAGLFLAILYTRGIFTALNSVWKDIVRTEMMVVDIQALTLIKGLVISMVVTSSAIFFPLKKFLQRQVSSGKPDIHQPPGKISLIKNYKVIFFATGTAAVILIISQFFRKEAINATVFFIAGGLLLVSGITAFRYFLNRFTKWTVYPLKTIHLSLKNNFRNPSRSMAIVILFALATFLVVSTGSNRKDLFIEADDPSSGTGGFLFYAESTVPVLQNLNNPDTRFEFGLGDGYRFIQFRKSEGDDASCLNLNKIVNPIIIATDPVKLSGRFSFVTRVASLPENDPWSGLNVDLPGGLIPAIADETVIKWGLGMKVGDTLQYLDARGKPMNLLLVGGLAPSIFQGKVIISESNFLSHFPQSSGTSVFLIEGTQADSMKILTDMDTGLRDFGMVVQLAAMRLVEFNSITNTYLSIFLVLGALGLLLGTVGLGIVLFKSILERKNEVALLRALGYGKKTTRKIINNEYFLLLVIGTGIGFLAALIATLPSILSPNTDISLQTLVILMVILLFNGWVWTRIMTMTALKNKNLYESLRND